MNVEFKKRIDKRKIFKVGKNFIQINDYGIRTRD